MRSFKQFLVESQSDKTIAEILDECQAFIRESDGRFIYRGLSNPVGEFQLQLTLPPKPEVFTPAYKMDVRKDRRPLHTGQRTHDALDEFLTREFGIAGRSQTLFVSGGIGMARGFGEPYVIFPRGKYKFLWSPNVTDLLFFQVDAEDTEEDLERKMQDLAYQADSLPEAIESAHEIMLACDSFYAIPATRDNIAYIRRAMDGVR